MSEPRARMTPIVARASREEVPVSAERSTVRTPPVQRRASDRIDEILDAAAAVVDEVGTELLTTTLVAERAGAGVGTVYRYFPDRIAILQGIADRNVRVLGERFEQVVADERGDVLDDLTALFRTYVELYRDLPGYRSVRTGESLPTSTRPRGAVVVELVERVTASIGRRYGVALDAEYRERLVDCFHVVDAVVGAAFVDDPAGDDHLIALALEVARAVSQRRLGLLPPCVPAPTDGTADEAPVV